MRCGFTRKRPTSVYPIQLPIIRRTCRLVVTTFAMRSTTVDPDSSSDDAWCKSPQQSPPRIQLGFCVEIEDDEHLEEVAHRSPDYSKWDGGQVGGRPVWLDPEHLPTALQCRQCCTPIRFICQLYAPVEYLDGRAFHRSLYVFACPTCCSSPVGGGDGVRVLRAQLPAQNPYFPNREQERKEPDNKITASVEPPVVEEVNWQQHKPTSWNEQHLCAVCGQIAMGKCPLQQEYFCGPSHQREYKMHVYDKRQRVSMASSSIYTFPSVYHMTELVVEEEPEPPSTNGKEGTIRPLYDHDDSDDSDADLEQEDLNQMTGASNRNNAATSDSTTLKFYERIRERPNAADQCLRYCRWPAVTTKDTPLWCKSDQLPDNIPACPYCGGPRSFEFQLMPQMLHFLLRDRPSTSPPHDYTQLKQALEQTESLVQQAPPEQIPPALIDAKNAAVQRVQRELLGRDPAVTNNTEQTAAFGEIDWGIVAVYTCQNSCSQGKPTAELGGYREEYAWVQSSLDR